MVYKVLLIFLVDIVVVLDHLLQNMPTLFEIITVLGVTLRSVVKFKLLLFHSLELLFSDLKQSGQVVELSHEHAGIVILIGYHSQISQLSVHDDLLGIGEVPPWTQGKLRKGFTNVPVIRVFEYFQLVFLVLAHVGTHKRREQNVLEDAHLDIVKLIGKAWSVIRLDHFAITKDLLPWLFIIVLESFLFVSNRYFDKVSDDICGHMLKDLGNCDRL